MADVSAIRRTVERENIPSTNFLHRAWWRGVEATELASGTAGVCLEGEDAGR